MIAFLKRILDAVIFALGFIVGRKTSNLEHENALLRAEKKDHEKNKKRYEEIKNDFNVYIDDYLSNTVPEGDRVQPKTKRPKLRLASNRRGRRTNTKSISK